MLDALAGASDALQHWSAANTGALKGKKRLVQGRRSIALTMELSK
jgi:hypothetical protein